MRTRRERGTSRTDRMTCPKCKSNEVKLRGGLFKILFGRLRRKHHYSCRRCLIYWSSSRYQQNPQDDHGTLLWLVPSFGRWKGRVSCFIGRHRFGELRRTAEGGKTRVCRRCNKQRDI